MKLRTLFLIIIFGLIGVFAALNWNAFMAPTSLWLGFASVQAPLGLIMLGMLIFLIALFLVYVVYLQSSVLLDTRRHNKEQRDNRKLADEAEASRFTELRAFLETELAKQAEQNAEARTAQQARLDKLDQDMQARLDKLDQELRTSIEQSGNTLAAYICEAEDRLEKAARGQAPESLS